MHLNNGKLKNNSNFAVKIYLKTMKTLLLKFCRFILPLLGVSSIMSCEGLIIEPRMEYGVPHSSFEVKCKVIDSKTNANVKGITLTPGEMHMYIDEQGKEINHFNPLAEGIQSETGIYLLKGTMFHGCCDAPVLHVKLNDLDPKQDGNYKDSIYVVPLTKVKDADKGSNWYKGEYGADVTLKAEQIDK